MGANYSSSNNLSKDGFRHTIDYIATYYIVTMDFESLKKLTDKEYCNQLIVLTSNIISKYATTRDIQYMVRKQGDMNEPDELKHTKVTYFSKNMIDRELPEMVKREMCMSIASFYIRIAHLFSAIILTINPIYKYRDEYGVVKEVNWANKKDIPEGVDVDIEYSNICNNRINVLEPNENSQQNNGIFQKLSLESSNITLKPSICHLQFKPNLLIEEPGIKELEVLYYDVYDYNEGRYNSMSPSSRQQYQADVREFYKSFTGSPNEVPSEIKSFNDIPIKQNDSCNDIKYSEPITISSDNSIYKKYADNLNEMKRHASLNQERLMDVISKLFVYTINKKTGKKQIRINPRLNDTLLDTLTQQSRSYIKELYVGCQQSYDKGVHLYQDIVETILSKTLDNRISNTENEEYDDYEEFKDIQTIVDNPTNDNDNNPIREYTRPNTNLQNTKTNEPPREYSNQYPEKAEQYREYSNQYPEKAEQYREDDKQYPEKAEQYREDDKQYENDDPYIKYENQRPERDDSYIEEDDQYEKDDPYIKYENQHPERDDPYIEEDDQYPERERQYAEYSNQYPKPDVKYDKTSQYKKTTEYPYSRTTDIPTIYTHNDRYDKSGNISVSSLNYSDNKREISDRDITEELNRVEFKKNTNMIK